MALLLQLYILSVLIWVSNGGRGSLFDFDPPPPSTQPPTAASSSGSGTKQGYNHFNGNLSADHNGPVAMTMTMTMTMTMLVKQTAFLGLSHRLHSTSGGMLFTNEVSPFSFCMTFETGLGSYFSKFSVCLRRWVMCTRTRRRLLLKREFSSTCERA